MNHHSIEEILAGNRAWVADTLTRSPQYFENLSTGQTPPYLYIGCSDSRLPLTKFMQTEPGEIFVHRNIANQVSLTDINFLAVLDYAIAHLKVKYVIICGHYFCGGIQAALEGTATGLVDNWVNPIRELYLEKQNEIDVLPTREAKLNRLSELNVAAQVKNLYQMPIMRKALRDGNAPNVHGWVLDIRSGLIQDLQISTSEWQLYPSCLLAPDPETVGLNCCCDADEPVGLPLVRIE